MRSTRPFAASLALLFSLLLAGASAAWAGGPLILFDPATRTPYAYPAGTVNVYTDLGNLGIISNAQADANTAFGFGQWNAVPTSYFNGAVAGDFASIGLGDITELNANTVIGVFNGGGIHVIYDDNGLITQNVLGAPPGVLGIATPEFATSGTNILTESWVVLNGQPVDPGDPAGVVYQGVFTHEFGHSINLAHTQTNGAIVFTADATGPGGCAAPYGGGPALSQTETMYPFIDVGLPTTTGDFQGTVEHPDDTTSLSDIYPTAGYPAGFATITGRVFDSDGVTEVTGVNVIARNLADPFRDAVSALSGDFTQGALGNDGLFTFTGLTPGASYVVYIDAIAAGGFSTPPTGLVFAEEFYNVNESANPVLDDPCDFTALATGINQTINADIVLQGTAAPVITLTEYCVDPLEFRFKVEFMGIPTSGTTVFRAAADDIAFGGNTERIAVNFDNVTGVLTYGPIVDIGGVPPFDRWVDGAFTNFTLTNPATGHWILEGTVPHGGDPLLAGDTIRETVLRTTGFPDVAVANAAITNCAPPTITVADYCVQTNGDTEFVTEMENLPLAGTGIFRIAADDIAIGGADFERIALNFDLATGVATFGPTVEHFGAGLDRWVDGPLAVWSLTNLGPGAWRFEGTAPGGVDVLTPADLMRDTRIRSPNNPDVSVFVAPIVACNPPNIVVSAFGGPGCTWPGDVIGPRMWVRVANTSADPIPNAFRVVLVLSSDLTIDAADPVLDNGIVVVPGLAGGGDVVVSFPAAAIPAGATVADQYIGVWADYTSTVVETDETDNTDLQPICVNANELGCAQLIVDAANGGQPVSLYNVPDGSGLPLTAARAWDGIIGSSPASVDATVKATILDRDGAPLAGLGAGRMRLATTYGGLSPCPGGTDADGPTDANGTTVFTGPLEAGGFSAHSVPLIDCNEGQVGGDLLSRGFYIPNYPGSSLDRVEVWISANTAGVYDYTLTARVGAYDGPVVGVGTARLTQSGSSTDNQLAAFEFAEELVVPGTTITFALAQTAGPGASLYAVNPTSAGCGIVQTNGTAPPLDTFRRDGIRARVFGAPAAGAERTIVLGPEPVRRAFYGQNVMLGASNTGELFSIDLVTGAASLLCTNPTGATEIAYDHRRGALVYQHPNGSFALQVVDVDACAFGPVVPDGHAFTGMAYVDGKLFATGIDGSCGPSTLYVVDPADGSSVPIGPTGMGPIAALAWDPLNCTMYGVTGCQNSVLPQLVWVDLNTGKANAIGPLGAALGGLEVGPDGELYGGGNQSDGGNLYRVDRVTGQASLIGPTGFGSVNGLALKGLDGLPIYHNSADNSGNGVVDIVDTGEFSIDFLQGYRYRSDFTWNGVIDIVEIGDFAIALGAACASPKAAVAAAAPTQELGIFFDPAGTQRNRAASAGEEIQAWAVLRGSGVRKGVTAFEFEMRSSENVEVVSAQTLGVAHNFSEAPDFVVGLGEVARAEAEKGLVLLHLNLRVLDEQPGWVELGGAGLRSLGADLPVVVVREEDGPHAEAAGWNGAAGARPRATLNDAAAGDGPALREGLALHNVPNPFNPATEFRFRLEQRGRAAIRIFDLGGRQVRKLDLGMVEAGPRSVRWDGTDGTGRTVSSGLYFYRLYLDGKALGEPRKMTLLK